MLHPIRMIMFLSAASSIAHAAPATTAMSLSAVDGQTITVPAEGNRVSVLVFVRPDQPQSLDAIKQIRDVVGASKEITVTLIISAAEAKLADAPWPVVLDPEYEVSGKLNVHAWPTTLVFRPDGSEAAHLAGLRPSFATALAAHIDAAAGRLDEAGLQQQLANPQIVTDTPRQMAARHLHVAEQHLSRGRLDAASSELETALKLNPGDPQLLIFKLRVLLEQGDSAQAAAVFDQIPADAAPGWLLKTLHTRILVAREQWDQARAVATEALKLNPKPAEAHYLSGLIAQHDQDFSRAAEQYRLAYESLEK